MDSRALSLAALSLLDAPPPRQVRAAAQAGFSHVGLRLLPATDSEPHYPMVGDTPLVRETLAALADSGLAVSDIEILRLTPELEVAALEPLFETAARFGARQALVAGNDSDYGRAAENLARLAELGRHYQVTLNLEPMPWLAVSSLAQASELIALSGREDVGILVDALHFYRAGESLASLGDIPSSRLNYCQICDAPARNPGNEAELIHQARCDRLPPGAGELDLRGLLAALPPDLPVSVEVPLAGARGSLPPEQRAALLCEAARALL